LLGRSSLTSSSSQDGSQDLEIKHDHYEADSKALWVIRLKVLTIVFGRFKRETIPHSRLVTARYQAHTEWRIEIDVPSNALIELNETVVSQRLIGARNKGLLN
jgi:hypothetical protein